MNPPIPGFPSFVSLGKKRVTAKITTLASRSQRQAIVNSHHLTYDHCSRPSGHDPWQLSPATASDSVDNRPPLGVAQTTMVHTMPFPEASSKYRRGVGMEHRDCDRVSSGKRRDQQMLPLPQDPGEEMEPGSAGAPDVGTNCKSLRICQ